LVHLEFYPQENLCPPTSGGNPVNLLAGENSEQSGCNWYWESTRCGAG